MPSIYDMYEKQITSLEKTAKIINTEADGPPHWSLYPALGNTLQRTDSQDWDHFIISCGFQMKIQSNWKWDKRELSPRIEVKARMTIIPPGGGIEEFLGTLVSVLHILNNHKKPNWRKQLPFLAKSYNFPEWRHWRTSLHKLATPMAYQHVCWLFALDKH